MRRDGARDTSDGRFLVFSRIRHEGEPQVADDPLIVAADVLPGP